MIQLEHAKKYPFMGKFLDKEGLKSPFCRQFCKRFNHHLRASSGFQAFLLKFLWVKYYSDRVALRCSFATFTPKRDSLNPK
jgi:hypothetical protein